LALARRIGVRAQFGDTPATPPNARLPNWDPTPNLLPTVATLTLPDSDNQKCTTHTADLALPDSCNPKRRTHASDLALPDSSGFLITTSAVLLPPNSSDGNNPTHAAGLALPDSSDCLITTSAVLLGSDPDSACHGSHCLRRLTESGSDPNSTVLHRKNTALHRKGFKKYSCQRTLHKGYSLISYINPATQKTIQQTKALALARRIGVSAQFGDTPATSPNARLPNWDPTPMLLPTSVTLTLPNSGSHPIYRLHRAARAAHVLPLLARQHTACKP